MKIAIPRKASTSNRVNDPPPIPLERSEKKVLKKSEYITLKLRSNPTEKESQTYDLILPYYNSATPEEWLEFRSTLDKAIIGQNITKPADMFSMARRVLQGDALASFEEAAKDHGEDKVEKFNSCLDDVTSHVFPQRALQKQKRCMRRSMRKPSNMTVREYATRINELNTYLEKFPPNKKRQRLDDDEILDLLEFGVPRSWQNQMTLQGFDPQSDPSKKVIDFVKFCERIENSTQEMNNNKNNPIQNGSSKRNGEKKRKLKNYIGEIPTCILHGEGHSTEECKTIQKWAKRQKSEYAQKNSKSDGKFSNWKKKDSNKKFTKNDLNAMVAKAVKHSVQEAFAMHTEECTKAPNDSEADDDSSALELGNIELNNDLFSDDNTVGGQEEDDSSQDSEE